MAYCFRMVREEEVWCWMITESDDAGAGGQGSHPDGFQERIEAGVVW